MRICTACKKSLPETTDYFYNTAANFYKKGYRRWYSTCIKCTRNKQKEYRRNLKDKVNAQNRRSWANRVNRDHYTYIRYLWSLTNKYNTTEQKVRDLMDEQKGCCAICQESLPLGNKGKFDIFSIDHCHKTNKVRGLLCSKCNRSIGSLGDDANGLYKAYKYLKEFQECH